MKGRSMREEFVTIPDTDVQHIWDTSATDGDECCADAVGDVVAVPPTFYAESGEPACSECGETMKYVETQIRKQRIEIHVRGGVAYGPDDLPAWVELEIIDHDNEACGE